MKKRKEKKSRFESEDDAVRSKKYVKRRIEERKRRVITEKRATTKWKYKNPKKIKMNK